MSDEKYTMKIPRELKEFFKQYIEENPGLGFNTVSQLALHILQDKAFEIKKEMEKSK